MLLVRMHCSIAVKSDVTTNPWQQYLSVYMLAELGEEAGKRYLIVTFSLVNNLIAFKLDLKTLQFMRTVTRHHENICTYVHKYS